MQVSVGYSNDRTIVLTVTDDTGVTVMGQLTPGDTLKLMKLLGSAVDVCMLQPGTRIVLPERTVH